MRCRKDTLDRGVAYVLLLVFSCLVMALCTASSPLYSGHDWTDANTYLTMGRGLLRGCVPYRDLFDHKGPLLYCIYAVGALLHPSGFFGVFVLQTAAMFCTLTLLYRTALLLVGGVGRALACSVGVPIFLLTAGVYYLPQNLDYGGGSAEEFCIPLFALSLWAVTKCECQQSWPRGVPAILGFAMGCALQIKFNLALFWPGLLAPIVFRSLLGCRWRELLAGGLSFGAGAAASAAPYLLYAAATHSLPQFWEAYVRFNCGYAAGGASLSALVKRLALQTCQGLLGTPVAAIAVLGCCVGLAVLRGCSVWWRLSVLGGLLGLCAAVFVGRVMPYTLLPLLLFAYVGLLALWARLPPALAGSRRAAGCLLCLCLLACVGQNKVLFYKSLRWSEADTCQRQIARLVRSGPYPNPTLLEAGMLNRGFYNELGLIPSVFYFYLPNVTYAQHPEILDSQLAYIAQETTDYVVLQGSSAELSPAALPDEPMQAQLYQEAFAHYQLVQVVPGTGAVSHLYYYLFVRPGQ